MSTSPHDGLFKAVFGQPEHARGALRAVVPAAVAEALDWPTLAPCAGSFIDPALSERHTVLFSAAWRGGGEALGRLVAACFKHARPRADLLEILSTWADVMREVIRAPDGLEALALVVRCILPVNDHVEPEALQAFLERVAGPEAKDTIMTAGQRLIEQGIQQGERAVLLQQLRKRFGAQANSDIEQRLASASAEQVATWVERVLSAATLPELLAD